MQNLCFCEHQLLCLGETDLDCDKLSFYIINYAKLKLLRKLEERRGEERRGVEEDERGVMGEAGSHTLSV